MHKVGKWGHMIHDFVQGLRDALDDSKGEGDMDWERFGEGIGGHLYCLIELCYDWNEQTSASIPLQLSLGGNCMLKGV